MIRPFLAKDNAVYLWGVDVDWMSSPHLRNMLDGLKDKKVDFYNSWGTIYFKHEKDRTLFLLKWAGSKEFQ